MSTLRLFQNTHTNKVTGGLWNIDNIGTSSSSIILFLVPRPQSSTQVSVSTNGMTRIKHAPRTTVSRRRGGEKRNRELLVRVRQQQAVFRSSILNFLPRDTSNTSAPLPKGNDRAWNEVCRATVKMQGFSHLQQ